MNPNPSLTQHSCTGIYLYTAHSPVQPFRHCKYGEINWLVHKIQTRLTLACKLRYVYWPKFLEHNTTLCRGSPTSYHSRYQAHPAWPPLCNDHIGRQSLRNKYLICFNERKSNCFNIEFPSLNKRVHKPLGSLYVNFVTINRGIWEDFFAHLKGVL